METTYLKAGETLTITADAVSSGTYWRVANPGSGTNYGTAAIGSNQTVRVGPFEVDRVYAIASGAGTLTFTQAVEDQQEGEVDDFEGLATSLATVPAGRQLTVGSNDQLAMFGTWTINGQVTVNGEARVSAWPA